MNRAGDLVDDHQLDDHPDLNDADWMRKSERRAKADVRKLRRRARRRQHRGKLVSVAALAVIALLIYGLYRAGKLDDALGRTPLAGGTTTATTATPTTTQTSMVESFHVDLTQPFTATPAAGWSDGEAGIVAPAAVAVGDYPAEKVAAVLDRTRQALIAGRLYPRMLNQRDPEPFLALFSQHAQEYLRPLLAGDGASNFTTRLAEGFHLLPVAPKVSGTMSASVGEQGELVVHTNYVFAYAFATDHPERLTGAMDLVAIERADVDFRWYEGARWRPEDRGLTTGNAQSYAYSMACEAHKKGFLAPTYSERNWNGGRASHDSAYYFDPSKPISDENGCEK
ncbi:hypothetical protein F0L68_03340 [Solihabitans fulvus]|uniref:Uncharacterized protein n=1 Tax=Solihabitans fulvus TaxID=1892852 RepID=A0A5B2XTK0_9PSEU|nr:hypothetical protein [Solihabitans fulvus]KAA2266161.1 hypothetical protein F0L68_03340 [Solihabitans fulvus]